MEEYKNNAVEKVENAIENKENQKKSMISQSKTDSVEALRERHRIEKAKAYALRLREKSKIKEQKLINEREQNKRAHLLRSQELRAKKEEREKRALDALAMRHLPYGTDAAVLI